MLDEGIQITIKVGQRDFPATLNGARIEESWETDRAWARAATHTKRNYTLDLHGWTKPQITGS